MLEAFLIVLLCANTLFFGLLWWGQLSWHNDYMRLLDVLDKRLPPITNVTPQIVINADTTNAEDGLRKVMRELVFHQRTTPSSKA